MSVQSLYSIIDIILSYHFHHLVAANHLAKHLEDLRKEISDYRPGTLTRRDVEQDFKFPERAVLGVFGAQDSGKSTCLNSLLFAYTGKKDIRKKEMSIGQANPA